MNFRSPLASGEITVYEIKKGSPVIVRKSTVLAELPNRL
jgi:hypothetical protein